MGSTVFHLLRISAALGQQELLLGFAQILHDGITGAGHSDRLTKRTAAGDAGLQEALGHKAVHGADMCAVGLLVAEDLSYRAIAAWHGPPNPLCQCSLLGWANLLLHLRIAPLSRLLSSRQ